MSFNTALVVDDSKLARITLRKLLKKKNIAEVTMVASAQEAFDLLESSLPDIIFMDHMMPDMDGFEATKKIKANPETEHIPIIMCTGKEDANYLDLALEAGASGMLSKPPIGSDLHKVLDQTPVTPSAKPATPKVDKPVAVETPAETPAPVVAGLDKAEIEDLITSNVKALLTSLKKDLTTQVNKSIEDIQQQITDSKSEAEPAAAIDEAEIVEKIQAIVLPKIDEAIKSESDKNNATVDERLQAMSGDLEKQISAIETPTASTDGFSADQIKELEGIAKTAAGETATSAANDLISDLTKQVEDVKAGVEAVSKIEIPNVNVSDITDQVRENIAGELNAKISEEVKNNSPEAAPQQELNIEEVTETIRSTLASEMTEAITSLKPKDIDEEALADKIKESVLANMPAPSDNSDNPVASALSEDVMEEVVEMIKTQATTISQEVLNEQLEEKLAAVSPSSSGDGDLSDVQEKAITESVNAAKEMLEKIQKDGDSEQVVAALAALNSRHVEEQQVLADKMTKLQEMTEKFYMGVGIIALGLVALALATMG